MPFTVITLKNAPKSLRGDLTKWMQEIATGVYVGNFNSKVRDKLWDRVVESVSGGEATMSYAYRNEIGYSFCTINANKEVVDIDGIPLILRPNDSTTLCDETKFGFSNAAMSRKAKKFSSKLNAENLKQYTSNYIVAFIGTDLYEDAENEIRVYLLKYLYGKEYIFNMTLFKVDGKYMVDKLEYGGFEYNEKSFSDVIYILNEFVQEMPIVVYDSIDKVEIIASVLKEKGYNLYRNKVYELIKFVKKENKYFNDYSLENVLNEYGIEIKNKSNEKDLLDGLYILSTKVNKFVALMEKK